jgi:anti-sigma regulatory factor (Ser/Thr protein kinase)
MNNEITVYSSKKELKHILYCIHNDLKEYNLSNDCKFRLSVVIEEIFINIIKHGYKNVEDNKVKMSYEIEEDPLAITVEFVDEGILFNPVIYMDNLDLYMEIIGSNYKESGLGILIIKNSVDEITYKNDNNQNMLKFKKILE